MRPPLFQRIAAGDQAAVAECIDRYGSLVWSLARRMSPTTNDAEDAVQEIFIELWSSARRYDSDVASETTFISMIARRKLIDRLRKHQRQPVQQELGPATQETPSPGGDGLERTQDVQRAKEILAALRPERRDVLKMSILEGWSHRAIAEKLGLPLGTVKTHVRRGLMEIRDRMVGRRSRRRNQVTP